MSQRQAFGSALIDYPLMASVIADLTLESEAATALAIRLAGAADRAARGDAAEADFLRLALPAAKYWVCKRTPLVTGEALECLGGNGYVEDSPMPRLYRDAPLNSIWEGSGNITALDVLRALTRTPQAAEAVLAEIDEAAGADRRLDRAAARLREDLAAAAKAGAEADLPGPPARRAAGPGAPGRAAGPARPGAGRRRVLRLAAGPGGGRWPGRTRRPVRHAARRRGAGRGAEAIFGPRAQVKSPNASLAGNRLPARCHLGRVGHELCPVFRGRGAG